jgi:hypothetical protein
MIQPRVVYIACTGVCVIVRDTLIPNLRACSQDIAHPYASMPIPKIRLGHYTMPLE